MAIEIRPTTDDMDVALAMSGTDILTEFGADPQVEAAIAAILDGLADCSLTAATIAHVDLTQRLSVLVGQRRRVVQAALTNWPADAGDWMRERAELAQRAYAMADAMLEARNALRAELERACGRGNV